MLERLFLVRRVRAWHRNTAKRLVKSPKVHLLDTGLAATLADLTAADWLGARHRMGYLLESFVVQQLIAQAAGSLAAGDGRGLVRLAERCGGDFQQGLLLYAGEDLLPLADKRMLAVPLSELWER